MNVIKNCQKNLLKVQFCELKPYKAFFAKENNKLNFSLQEETYSHFLVCFFSIPALSHSIFL